MVQEISHLQEIVDHLSGMAADPDTLPESSEQVITDLKGANFTFKYKVKPSTIETRSDCIIAIFEINDPGLQKDTLHLDCQLSV